MARPKKDGHHMTIYIEQELYERLQDFCSESGVTRTFAVEKGIRMYLEQQEKMRENENQKQM